MSRPTRPTCTTAVGDAHLEAHLLKPRARAWISVPGVHYDYQSIAFFPYSVLRPEVPVLSITKGAH